MPASAPSSADVPRSRPAGGSDPASPNAAPRTPTRTAAVVLLLAEAALLILAAGMNLWLVLGGALDARFGLALVAFLLVLAAAVGAAGRSVRRGGRFGVGFGITWQLFQALVAVSLLRAGLYLPGAVPLALAISGFIALTRVAGSNHERALRGGAPR